MKPETIVKRALTLQRRMAEDKVRLAALEDQAIACFPEAKSRDELVTPSGIIKLTRNVRWIPKVEMIDEARNELGQDFDDVFEAIVERSVPGSVMDELQRALGHGASDFIREDVKWSLRRSFQDLARKEPENELVQDAAPFFDHKVSERIKFKGVE